jgi:myo-inositol-1(or 4)-monophosphatase
MSAALDLRLKTALAAANEAAAMALDLRAGARVVPATLKGAHDWLTEADQAVERFIWDRVSKAHPEDGFQGEEAGSRRSGSLRWVVDPIDGTSNYMRGGSRFCVSIGLVEERSPLIGVVVAPALGKSFSAISKRGAMMNGVPIRVSGLDQIDSATVEIGWSLRRPYPAFINLCEKIASAGAAPRVGGSATLGLSEVASGRLDGYVELHINFWDVAAALVILAEAGARVSPFMEGSGPTTGDEILACTPELGDRLVAATGIHA